MAIIVVGGLLWLQYLPKLETFANYDGIPNPYVYLNQHGPRNPIIYQGQGIPLIHEDHPTMPVEGKSMFYFADYRCSPECCLYSSDSCSNGCICRGVQPQTYLLQNKHISPRS